MNTEKETINTLLDQLNFAGEHILNAKTAIEDTIGEGNAIPEYMKDWENEIDLLYAKLEETLKLVYLKDEELRKPGSIFY